MVWAQAGNRQNSHENMKAQGKQQPPLLSTGQMLLQLKQIVRKMLADLTGLRQQPNPEPFYFSSDIFLQLIS